MRFYITTTLPYVNADLHVGQALEFIRADIIARYKKMSGFEVFFNTGTDEHGIKIHEKAKSVGKSTQEFVDERFLRFKEYVKMFGMMDGIHFIRTTDASHEKAACEFWNRVYKSGYIYKKNYQAKYCIGCESEKTDRELVNGHCPDHPGIMLEIINEENYFFKFSEFQKPLLDFYSKNPNFVVPDFRFNETKAFVERGLEDFSVSRLKSKMPWGIEIPCDTEHVMYVWFDALTNYISTLGWPEDDENSQFYKFWINGTPTQYCGKDNNRFQSAIWQAMLMAVGIKNSSQIIINGHITADGGMKMSKTLGNIVDLEKVIEEYSTEALRFFLAKEIGFEDSPFGMERFKDSYNASLANGLGNLTSRVMKMAETNLSSPVLLKPADFPEDFTELMNSFDIKKASDLIWREISACDAYIQETKPFTLIKTDEAKACGIITELVARLHKIAFMLYPILPQTSDKIMELIKTNKSPVEPLFLRK